MLPLGSHWHYNVRACSGALASISNGCVFSINRDSTAILGWLLGSLSTPTHHPTADEQQKRWVCPRPSEPLHSLTAASGHPSSVDCWWEVAGKPLKVQHWMAVHSPWERHSYLRGMVTPLILPKCYDIAARTDIMMFPELGLMWLCTSSVDSYIQTNLILNQDCIAKLPIVLFNWQLCTCYNFLEPHTSEV